MSYYFNRFLPGKSFEEGLELVSDELKKEGFAVITEIDVSKTLKEKINVDFKKYKILGACNPHFAHQALLKEDKIGLLLPCNIIVEEHEDGQVEVAAMDPVSSLSSVQNKEMEGFETEIQLKIKRIINNLV